MPLGLFKKVGKYRGIGGLGAEPPAGSRGSAPSAPLEARAFSQSELPRKPPIDTHGRYIYNTCTGGGKKKKKKGKKGGGGKSERRGKSEKLASLMYTLYNIAPSRVHSFLKLDLPFKLILRFGVVF